MVSRRAAVSCLRAAAGALVLVGCGYPEFRFVSADGSGDATAIETTAVADAADAAVERVEVEDDTADDARPDPTDTTQPTDTTVFDVRPDTMPDGRDAADAPLDTRDAADMGSPTGCATSTELLCREFENSTEPTYAWTGNYKVGASTYSIDPTYFISPTHSFLSTIVVSSGEIAASVHRTFTAASNTTPMHADFWVRFDVIPGAGSKGPLFFKLARGTGGRGVALYVGDGGITVDALGVSPTTSYKAPTALSAGTWIHLRLEAQLVMATTGWLKLYVNDMTTPAVSKSNVSTTDLDETDVKVTIGLYDSPATAAVKAWYDDVKFGWN